MTKSPSLQKALSLIDKQVRIIIDRPLGSKHPKYDYIYPVNYGYIEGIISNDGEEMDAYVIGVKEPLEEFTGKVIAVIARENDDDPKLVVIPIDKNYSDEEIMRFVSFQEKFFKSQVLRD